MAHMSELTYLAQDIFDSDLRSARTPWYKDLQMQHSDAPLEHSVRDRLFFSSLPADKLYDEFKTTQPASIKSTFCNMQREHTTIDHMFASRDGGLAYRNLEGFSPTRKRELPTKSAL